MTGAVIAHSVIGAIAGSFSPDSTGQQRQPSRWDQTTKMRDTALPFPIDRIYADQGTRAVSVIGRGRGPSSQ
jgi:hypothetical protein